MKSALLQPILAFNLNQQQEDELVRSLVPSGIFSASSFWKGLENNYGNSRPVERLIWRGIVPLKVEYFTWLAIKGRIPIRDFLIRKGIIQARDGETFPY